jgi:AraC family transcriptional regulator, regulatory protein of adaptative response / methylated-DNA-[protein]-cysteine methyltransferase
MVQSARTNDAPAVVMTTIVTPLGGLVAAAREDGVCLLEFAEPERLDPQLATLRRRFHTEPVAGTNGHLARLQEELGSYFAGTLRRFTVPLIAPGTPFQERVWQQLLRIPYGQTCSYEELAVRVGSVNAQRAVGRANGTNRIAIVIPCHRVINKDGNLGGYGGRLWRKEALLRLERAAPFSTIQQELFSHA